MNYLFRILMAIMIVFGIEALFTINIEPDKVQASGENVTTFYVYADPGKKGQVLWSSNPDNKWQYWYNITSLAIAKDGSNPNLELGFGCFPTAGNFAAHWQGIYFDCTTLPSGVEITDVKLRVYIDTKQQDYYWQQFYGVYAGDPVNANVFANVDVNKWHQGYTKKRLSQVVSYDLISATSWVEFNIKDWVTGSYEYISGDTDKYIPFYILPTHFAQDISPIPWAGAWKYRFITIASATSAHPPELVITYQTNAKVRTSEHDTNAAVATANMTDGTEYTSNISWGTPRAAYKDDDGIWFKVNGAGGTLGDGRGENITLQLESDDNSVLLSTEDSIRVDGNYDWWIPAASLTGYRTGFIRAHETVSNVYSDWGYLADSPSTGERTNDIYSKNTEYPQWTDPFSTFVTTSGNNMFIHWKTNIDILSENSTHNLQMRTNGIDGNNNLFNHDFNWLQAEYYKCTNINAQGMLHWRYAIFVMDGSAQGFNDYDGMVLNLNKPLTNSIKGFIQPCIYRTSDNVVMTQTHTSYWYLLNDSEYLILSTDKDNYETNENVNLHIYVPYQTQIPTYLPNLTIYVSGASVATMQIMAGDNSLSFKAPSIASDYNIQFEFSGSGVENYSYIYQKGFAANQGGGNVVPGGTPEEPTSVSGWQAWLRSMLQRYGMNNAAGHWLLIFGLCIILAIVFRKTPAVATVLVLLVFAGGWVLKWIDPWFIALMCIGAGLAIYGFFRKREKGHTGDEE